MILRILTILCLSFVQDAMEISRWTEDEVKQRIKEIFTPEEQKKVEVYRSKYYIIFTDSAVGGQNFAKILDNEVYAGFRELFPFKDEEYQKLMPIYLFKSKDGYFSFCERVPQWSRAQAEQSAGHAFRDYYATSYESPRDSVHFHEGAHQIMMNRLRLLGGGSWFQEGIAEYYQDRIERMNRSAEMKGAIRANEYLSFPKLFTTRSLLFSKGKNVKGYGGAGGRYGQAASVIQFLKEGPLKDKFPDFFVKVGRANRDKLEDIEKIIRGVYGMSISELEEKWKEYYMK